MKVGLLGATGYAGLELTNILDKHPHLELASIGSRSYAGQSLSDLHPRPYQGQYELITLEAFEDSLSALDAVFLSLPHGQSMDWVSKVHSAGVKVIDLSGDFRLKSKTIFEDWYNSEHTAPELISSAAYGLTEMNRAEIKNTQILANPGCYPTATLLGILPLASQGLLNEKMIIVDAKSGMSGAGKKLVTPSLYCEANESIRPYGTGVHRHTPEMEQTLELSGAKNTKVLFSPSVVPMERGILSSIYIQLDGSLTANQIKDIYTSAYEDEAFIRLIDKMPETRWVKNTNFCDIHIVMDSRTNTLVIHSAIDNLIKGAAGQAVQNANLMLGLNETSGLWL